MKNFGKTTDIRDIITVGYEADNAVLYSTSQSLTNNQKAQARTNIGAGTSNFDGDYKSLANKPTIPTKTSQLNNDSNFATTSQVEAKYTKPASGIPKTDLATAVQNSLTAADNAVRYTSQSLTDAQKVQARTNIGAGTSNFSGSYNDLTNKPTIPAAVSIVQSTGESTSSVMSQKATTDAVNSRLSKTDNTNIEVLGTKKATTTLGGNQLYAPNGVIFGGSAAAAGLVTKGICGVSTPSVGGACTKENLYINYDGNNDFNAGRQIVLNAGTVGNHLGSNMYQYTVPRGDIVKNWVEAKGYATSVKVNGNTVASSGGVVDIGTVLTDASKFATSAQGTKADNAMPKSGGTFTGNISVPKTITFTDETNPFIKMRTGGTDFYFQSTSGQFGLGPTWDKATHWDSNGNVTFPTVPKVGSSSLALKTDIPPRVTESTVSGWGFTKNEGTVTSVSVKMNGASKGTVTNSGTIDLGTVITAHQDISGKLDKTAYEVNKTIEFGSSGVLYVGKFKVYDTNVTCEVTSTTNVTYSGKLVIATQNNVIQQMTVYGDAANTVAPNFFIKPSSASDPYIEIYFKPASWSKNVVHIYGSAIEAEPTNVCTDVPTVPSTATLKPTNALNSKANLNEYNEFNGGQDFILPDGSYFFVSDENDSTLFCVNKTSVDIDPEGLGTISFAVGGSDGASGQVLTSQGAGKTPQWTTPAIKSATLTGTILTITL